MRICVVHNEYGRPSGEEMVVNNIACLLRERGHDVISFGRSSNEISNMFWGNIRAFFSGIYSWSSKRKMAELISKEKPDIIHVHNVYPLISPAVLSVCRRAGVPVIMTVHNYRLVCPNGLHLANGQVCEKCRGGREYWCVLGNCENNFFKSTGYAVRNYFARKLRLFRDNVDIFICLTEFQKARLIAEDFPADQCIVIFNMVDEPNEDSNYNLGDYVGFVGRISPEKGISTLLAAAKKLPDMPFKAAGEYDPASPFLKSASANFQFCGYLRSNDIKDFYQRSRFVVLPSICFEGFPMMILDAMLRQKPVICSRIGALPEIVEDGITGLLFNPGDENDLAEKISYLWKRPQLCRTMGKAAREKVLQNYSKEKFYEQLMMAYERARQPQYEAVLQN